GEKWMKINDDDRFRQRAWYFTHIFADPKSVDTVYELNTGLFRSTDGGKNFAPLPAPHGDHHGLWIDPTNPQRMINGNDGGATITANGGKNWTPQDNQPTAQFYHVATDNRFPYYVYGAQQDNSTVAIASASEFGAIGRPDWYPVGGGESGFVVPYPPDPDIIYAGSYDGLITRYNRHTWQEQDINPWPDNPMGSGAAELKHRFQWTAPIAISLHDPNVLYHGAEVLFKSTNGGMSWTAISPDLTRNDKSKQGSSGGPLTQDNTSVEYYDTIFAIAESPIARGEIWVGSDDGLVHLTRDDGKTWSDITPKDMPKWSMVSLIEPSPYNAASAYLAIDAHRLDDVKPYIFKTSDYGKTWTAITAGIPEGSYVHAVREDPKRKGLLFAGTESGVYVSFDDGARWQSLQMDMPTVPVHDLTVNNDDLVIATHGRAFWILDDITPLRQFTTDVAGEAVHLYAPRPAYRPGTGGGFRPRGAVGQNPPGGAVIDYYLKSAPGPKEEVTLEILDGKGKVVRKFSSKEKKAAGGGLASEFPGFQRRGEKLPVEAGLNRFEWDMRYEKPTAIVGAASWGGRPTGPEALPGMYQVKLTAGGKTFTQPLEIKLDPRLKTSQEDLVKQFELMTKITASVAEAHDAVKQIRDLHAQIAALKKRLTDQPHGKDLIAAGDQLDKKMTAVEDEIIQSKSKSSEDPLNYPIKLNDKLMALGSTVESAETAPTKQSYEVYDMLRGLLDAQLAKWKEIQSTDMAEFNKLLRKDDVPNIMLAPAAQP
ncbi:MAG TPA: glycosyl hydrolase, partial [Terriglobia bacterium]|nr:glycosyl hydrolase [Terriglobia bacterium]